MADAPYSHTIWFVKPGCEEEFVRRWTEFADWSAAEGLLARATLLRDTDDPLRFVSFGPWETFEAVSRWRTLAGFHDHVAALSALIERFEPSTLRRVVDH